MIGIFGGTFDPIHFGHLRAALEIREALGLRELRLLPLNQAVHRAQPLADGALRLAMVRAALDGEPGMVADDRELRRPGGSYSVDTLTEVRAEVGPDEPLCLLVGGDAFNTFFEWHRPRDILELAHLAVMQRPGSVLPRDPELREELERRRAQARGDLHAAPAGRIWLHRVSQLDIASSRIRRIIADGNRARFLLPDAVLRLAMDAGCYSARAETPTPSDHESTDSLENQP
jgi:nicotinate-nucleotide adenylyltransferase